MWWLFYSVLGVLGVVDIRRHILPQWLTYPLLIAGILRDTTDAIRWMTMLSSIAVMMAIFYLIRWIGFRIYQREALGMGDVVLMGVFVAWGGLHRSIISISIGALIASIVALWLIVIRKMPRDTRIPFGPFLISGWIIDALWL